MPDFKAALLSRSVIACSLACLSLTLTICKAEETNESSLLATQSQLARGPGVTSIAIESVPQLLTGQLLYIPIYQEIVGFKRSFPLTATLSIRNTDLNHPIVLETVDYYDTGGTKLKEYLSQPIQLAPLASTTVVVIKDAQAGGSGANFIVRWGAAREVSTPIVEAVMISTQSQQGLSFVSAAKVIEEQ